MIIHKGNKKIVNAYITDEFKHLSLWVKNKDDERLLRKAIKKSVEGLL